MLTYGIPPEFRGGVHLFIFNRHTPSGQSRLYRVTQLRTNGVHCRGSAGTGPVNLKKVPKECSFSMLGAIFLLCTFFMSRVHFCVSCLLAFACRQHPNQLCLMYPQNHGLLFIVEVIPTCFNLKQYPITYGTRLRVPFFVYYIMVYLLYVFSRLLALVGTGTCFASSTPRSTACY